MEYVDAQQGTNASLIIQRDSNNNDASLTVTGTEGNGILVKSGTGDASLTIENASVVANADWSLYPGVCVQSGASATGTPKISLTVNGGSLTASGGTSGGGLQFNVGNASASATARLTVADHAVVDARNGGIMAYGVEKPAPSGTGIVFDGEQGTVYGNVALQKDLGIESGETLTIPQGASLDLNGKTITVASGGKLEGTPTGNGAVKIAPTITTESLPNGTVGTAYSQTLAATGDPTITWSLADGFLPAGLSLSPAGVISGTPTADGTVEFKVAATNGSGNDSKEYVLTITPKSTVSVTGVTLDKETLELYTGGSATLTATVEPSDATNQNVTWTSSDSNVATVTAGADNTATVNAEGAGEADITATVNAEGGNKTATCHVTVTQSAYGLSADPAALNFGSAYIGYARPAARTVTVTNTGSRPLTLTQPASTAGFEVGTLSKAVLAAGETASFTVQPRAGLAAGTYRENITVSGSEGASATISAAFNVMWYSIIPAADTGSQQAVDRIESAAEGSTVKLSLSAGQTELGKEVFEALSGRDVTLEISLPGGVAWTVNGRDIPADARLSDLDLGVTLNSSAIPAKLIDALTGAVGTVQLSLAHDGEFGFTLTLTAPLSSQYAGLWANLYHYEAGALKYQASARVAADGRVSLPFTHASDFALVIDDHDHAPALPFADVAEGAWYYNAVRYVCGRGLMDGVDAYAFAPGGAMTRAMLVTILHRLAGTPQVDYIMPFDDVAPGAYYAEAVRWAASEGIVTGTGETTFAPDAPVTREQFAAILYRYARARGQGFTGAWAFPLAYADADKVSAYAYEPLCWLTMHGVIEGDGTNLRPQDGATRAEAAAMLMRFIEAVS